MTAPETAPTGPDLTQLGIELVHRHRLTAPEQGLQEWHIRILDGEHEVGTLRAARCQHYGAGNLAERMTDHGGLCAIAAAALFTPDGDLTPELEDAVEQAGNFLVLDQLNVSAPFDDQTVVTAVIAETIARLADTYYAVVLPTAHLDADHTTRLLAQAATDLAADPFTHDLQIIDTCLAAPEDAAAHAHDRFLSHAQHPTWHLDENDERPWPHEDEAAWSDEQADCVLSARTTAVLRLAAEELSTLAWQEVTALGDTPLPRGASGVFGRLPPLTLRRNGQWRRQMARTFDDLAADLQTPGTAWPQPRCIGEEMALHLIIDRARSITTSRPNAVHALVADLPPHHADYDWANCSGGLFKDHDVLMLFDARLDGLEDPDSDIRQALGLVNLAADAWFEPFDPQYARDLDRGYRL
ncbi:hypothetical protein [Streptomyces abyssomicinicus]|uniref:hypothetical protein n=1 Tax=Streptomyces abyssomicinicus TaxID=574929 RepID=UPI001FE32D84|nr:hypothetical protein [Streptomyces abyssomicinicus]